MPKLRKKSPSGRVEKTPQFLDHKGFAKFELETAGFSSCAQTKVSLNINGHRVCIETSNGQLDWVGLFRGLVAVGGNQC